MNNAESQTPTLPRSCYVIGVVLILYLLGGVFFVVAIHLGIFPWFSETWLLRTHAICAGFGVVGASMAAMRKYYQVLITDTTNRARGTPSPAPVWNFAWMYYYFTRPLLGGVLGALSFTLTFIGFQVLAKATVELSNHGRYLLFALAFVAGFAVSHVLDRVNSIARRTFKREPPITD
jgi:hypothetical protein